MKLYTASLQYMLWFVLEVFLEVGTDVSQNFMALPDQPYHDYLKVYIHKGYTLPG